MKRRAESCVTCYFFENAWTKPGQSVAEAAADAEAVEGYAGFCHRYPPPTNTAIRESDLFPAVSVGNWCGEWKNG